jgi:hypothetical protein
VGLDAGQAEAAERAAQGSGVLLVEATLRRVRHPLLAGAKNEQADLDLLHLSDSVLETCRYLLEAYQNESWKAPGQGGRSGSAPPGYP